MQIIQDPVFYLVALPGVIAIGLSKGGFAGVGTFAVPLLALYVPPLQAAAVLLPITILQDLISLWAYRRDWDAWNLKVLIPGGILGIGIAWALASYISDAAVRILVGLIGVTFVLNAWLGRGAGAGSERPPKRPNAFAGVGWAALSGFTSTLSQSGSPPFQVFVLPQRLPKLVYVGTWTIFFAVINALKVGPYFALGQFNTETLGTSLVMLPLAVLSNFFGIWLVRRTPADLFYRIAYVITFLLSLTLLWQGFAEVLRG